MVTRRVYCVQLIPPYCLQTECWYQLFFSSSQHYWRHQYYRDRSGSPWLVVGLQVGMWVMGVSFDFWEIRKDDLNKTTCEECCELKEQSWYSSVPFQTDLELSKEVDFSRILQLEEKYVREMCGHLIAVKPDLVITEKGLSDLASHFLVKNNISAIRRVRKSDNNRIARFASRLVVVVFGDCLLWL